VQAVVLQLLDRLRREEDVDLAEFSLDLPTRASVTKRSAKSQTKARAV
jgi:hypothetical protein